MIDEPFIYGVRARFIPDYKFLVSLNKRLRNKLRKIYSKNGSFQDMPAWIKESKHNRKNARLAIAHIIYAIGEFYKYEHWI